MGAVLRKLATAGRDGLRERSRGGLVHLIKGCRGNAKFGGDRGDRLLGNAQLYPTVGDSHGRDLEVIADPGQDRKALLAGDLFGR